MLDSQVIHGRKLYALQLWLLANPIQQSANECLLDMEASYFLVIS